MAKLIFTCAVVLFVAFELATGPVASADSPQYLKMAELKAAGVSVGCADVNWAVENGLIEAVEVRYLAQLGARCPDQSLPDVTEQYLVMVAQAAKGQLTCLDVKWNAARGYFPWAAAVSLLGLVNNRELAQYEKMVALQRSGSLQCADIEWNLAEGNISTDEAWWLRFGMGYFWEGGIDWQRVTLRCPPRIAT